MAELDFARKLKEMCCEHDEDYERAVISPRFLNDIIDILLLEPTTTEAEIRAKAIDEFAEKIRTELLEEHWINVGYRCFFERKINEIAEQLKEKRNG